MNKEQRDGLFLDNSVFIFDEKKPGFPIQSRIIQCLAILIGSWSSVSILMESLPMPVRILNIYFTILICTGIVYTLCLIPSFYTVKWFFGILLYGLFLFSRLPKLRNGFYILENAFLDRISTYYSYRSDPYIADYSKAAVDCSLLIILITIPIVTLLTIAIVRNRFVNVTSIILFLPVTLCFFVGVIPSEKYLIAYIAAILYLTRSGFSTHHVANDEQKVMLHRINSRAAVWLSLLSIFLFFFLKLFISEDKYDKISQIEEMKTEIQSNLFNFTLDDLTKKVTNFQLPTIKLQAGGLDGGELGKVGKVEYTDSEQLQITAPYDTLAKGIYLKGYVGSEYTGDRWEGHTSEDNKLYEELQKKMPEEEFSPVNQVSELIRLSGGILPTAALEAMSIKYHDANQKYLYAPYYTDFSPIPNMKYKQDLYAAPIKRKDKYSFVFYDANQLYSSFNQNNFGISDVSSDQTVMMSEFVEYEKLYKDFVYQVYTKLPEIGLDRLKQECSAVMEQNPGFGLADKINYVQNYLDQNTRYTLSPGKLPKDKDYVEYFLYENRKGYCAHFATAATLMLRAMGVPARYVEGYMVTPGDLTRNRISTTQAGSDRIADSTVEISVKDYNAHAWVEIYYDGFGWLPYDFTPGSNLDYSAFGKPEVSASPTDSPTPTPAAPSPHAAKAQTDTTKPDNTTPEAAQAAAQAIQKQQHKYDTLFLLIFIAAAIGFITVMILLLLHRRKKLMNTVNRNKRVIYLFSRMEKVLAIARSLGKRGAQLEDSEEYVKEHCPYIDKESFAAFMETVRKARYGKGKITKEELKQAEDFYQNMTEMADLDLPLIRKVYMKVILLL